jgi:hypothetical protein
MVSPIGHFAISGSYPAATFRTTIRLTTFSDETLRCCSSGSTSAEDIDHCRAFGRLREHLKI